MPDTFQAAIVLTLVILPGALYTWGIERVVGRWGIGLADRALRFAGISACFQTLFAPLTYHWYQVAVRPGRLIHASTLPLSLWLMLLAYVFGPLICGLLVGQGALRRSPWAQLVAGRRRAPHAWDEVFAQGRAGYVRLRVRSASGSGACWLAGWYGMVTVNGRRLESRVANYPEMPDLYLAQTVRCDERTGALLLENGRPVHLSEGLLIRRDEIEYLYFEAEEGAIADELEGPAGEVAGGQGAAAS